LEVVTTSSDKYETAFGFTEEEVFAAMDEMGMTGKDKVKKWYDGFIFGKVSDIYNPWSILNYLDKGKICCLLGEYQRQRFSRKAAPGRKQEHKGNL